MTKRKPGSKPKTARVPKAHAKEPEDYRRLYLDLEDDLHDIVLMVKLGVDAQTSGADDIEHRDKLSFAFGHLEKMIVAFEDKYRART